MPRYEIKLDTMVAIYHVLSDRRLVCKVQILGGAVAGVFVDGSLSPELEAAIRRWAKKAGYASPDKIEILESIARTKNWQSIEREADERTGK